MIGNSLQLIVKRTLAHWRLLSAVVVGVVLASTIMASSVMFFDALRDVALQRALSTHEASDIDVLVEAGQIPTNAEIHATMEAGRLTASTPPLPPIPPTQRRSR